MNLFVDWLGSLELAKKHKRSRDFCSVGFFLFANLRKNSREDNEKVLPLFCLSSLLQMMKSS